MGGLVVVLGAVLGVVGALPAVYLLEQALRKRGAANVATGLISVMISFIMLSSAILAVWLLSRDNVLAFGVAEAAAFLLVWVIEAVRAWRDAQRGASPRERK